MASDNDVEGHKYKWEIEPHPYDSDFDVLVTDDDDAALQALLDVAEQVWDGMQSGDEQAIKIRCNAVGKNGEV
jgi:hypothetical protein